MRYSVPLILILLAVASPVSGDSTANAFPRDRAVIHGTGTGGPYQAGIRFVGGSAAVDTTGLTPPYPAIIASDGAAGTITLDRPLTDGDSLAVFVIPAPAWLPMAYHRAPGETSANRPAYAPDYHAEAASVPKSFPGLSFGGSKTFDISVGNGQEAALNQSLALNISGHLTPGITLNAAISDQNIPISAEGNTAELEELDRVLIELRGKHFTADMGDTDLRRDGGRWLSWSRRLSGASLGASMGGVTVSGAGAVSEGRFRSTTLTPEEGNQGPYRLADDNGNTNITVIAGTERIWVNGERLSRGESGDYTIDYSTGEITFTARRIIGSDMRIVVDYEYTSESYRRTFTSGSTDAALFGGRVKLGIAAAREADDVSRPVLTDLSDADRAALSLAGDSGAVVSGIRSSAGDSAGYYDLVDGHLVYNAAGTGAYNATFSWAGQDSGSYRYSGAGVYVFVSEDERVSGSGASYEPMRTIAAPVSHGIAGFTLSAEPLPWMKLNAEAAGSSYDANTLSRRDDSGNGGGAWKTEIGLSPVIRAGAPLRLDLTANRSSRGETFRPLDRDRDAEENRRWDIPLTLSGGNEEISEFSGGASLAEGRFAGTGFSVSSGNAAFGDSARSERMGAAGAFRLGNRGEARLEANSISRTGLSGFADEDVSRLSGSTRLSLRGFVPSLSYERERDESAGTVAAGTGWDDVRAGLKTPETGFVRGGIEWYFRNELAKHGEWEDSSLVRGGSGTLDIGRGVAGSLRTVYSRRERTTGDERTVTDQAEIEGSYHPEGSRVRAEGSYRAGRLREASKSRSYIYVGAGRGAYRWEDANEDGIRDLDEFVPDKYGSYSLYVETLDDYTPVNTVHAYARLGLDLFGVSAPAASVKSETTFEVNEKSTASASDVFLLNFAKFRRAGTTTSGDSRIQQDLTAPFHDGSIRLRLFRLDSFNGEYVSGEERNSEEEESLRLRIPVRPRTDVEITLASGGKSRFMEGSSSSDFNVRTYSLDAECTLYPSARSSLGGSLAAGRDRDAVSGIRAVWWLLEPRYAYRISEKGKAETSYTLTSVRLGGGDSGITLPYAMARGNKEGANHAVTASYDHRVTNRMNITATYTGRKYAEEAFENFGQVQMRATF